ncbi:molecular chaperone DnaJ [Geotalea uraniireducens]|uniref:Molecular chaperone DnaJ n=1 Tax=Geotalea uraniireducens TaxID=351604 RepID=A0ABN6VSI3_9BACT|nr:J domain-containing protein [Geotalea uraniireducens]BDV43338.1 molecular chaperone DnaJ [Geotalea uraniireducens]
MRYRELRQALELFGLPDRITLKELKKRHRELVRKHHPDVGGNDDGSAIRQLNAAYRILLEYTENYRLSFAEDEFYEQNPDERLRMQFEDTALWGAR